MLFEYNSSGKVVLLMLMLCTVQCCMVPFYITSQDGSVGIVMDCGLNDGGSILGRGKRFFCTPRCLDQF
jgi:hypothetical protein